MKITFHLDSDDSFDNRREAKLLLESGAWKGVVEDMDNFLRGKLKYEDLDASTAQAYQAARDELWSLVKGSDLDLFTD